MNSSLKMSLRLLEAAQQYADEHGGFYPQGIVTDKDCRDGFLAGAEWQRKRSQWISVKDKLPEDFSELVEEYPDGGFSAGCVLVVTNYKLHYLISRVKNICEKEWRWDYEDDQEGEITHWMPIPKLTEGGEK